ncbi:NTP transferase domain-containing protein [Pontibacter pamirensis]|uniref:NTP transferase domain-containing protein n=1 Tax=Pontibacter pamirensis TaxID=2562824 RepID=UPI00192E4D9E|nr:NTP transferase domain-containing protein [Pontibacter pamirensis]
MISKDHKKHSVISRPAYGNFGRNEWAILGTPCGAIKTLADAVIKALSVDYKCAYVDASHAHSDGNEALPGRMAAGAVAEYTDQISYHQLDLITELNPFRFRQFFSDMDVVLVNGNHQQAKAQVVVIDESKKASLQKRLEQLTNVQLILLADNANEVFDFVQEAVPEWQELPLYRLSEMDKIIAFFQKQLQRAKPVLNGLVLAGGKSVRMGQDKGAMQWHGKEQRYYVADLLKQFCPEVFISCRPEQQNEFDSNYKTVADTFTGLGPYGAILSAFREQPDAAWLVVACDLPLLDQQTLQRLKESRSVSSVATTFESPHDSFPEPLITIWEPKSYPLLLSFLAQGYSCPRKVLRNSDINLLKPINPDALLNVNTPEDSEKVKQMIQE